MSMFKPACFAALAIALCGSSAADAAPRHAGAATLFTAGAALDARVPRLLAEKHAAGAGVVVIRGGRIVWSGYYGEQGPGVAASKTTMFNGASLAKTITAETALRLAAAGRISLDEPIWPLYAHPSLAADPRYRLLTPRIILSHRTGLLNWAYEYKDGRLAFVATPGERFTYSGAGYEILARFLEKKLGTPFEDLVRQYVFEPMGLKAIAVGRHPWMNPYLTTPMDSEGHYGPSYRTDAPENPDHPIRAWSAAADLFTTPEDYAGFLIGVMKDEGLTPRLARERRQIYSSFAGDPDWACHADLTPSCPRQYGFGLGWMVFKYGDGSIVTNGGNDSGENALVYFSPQHPGDGVVVFINGGGVESVAAELDIIDLIDPHQRLTAFYRQLIAHHIAAAKDAK